MIDLRDYSYSELEEIVEKYQKAKYWIDAVLEEAYADQEQHSLDNALEELACCLNVNFPLADLKYKRTNNLKEAI